MRSVLVFGALLVPSMALLGQVELAHTFSNGEVASATEVNQNFADLRDAIGPKVYAARLGTNGTIYSQNPPGWIVQVVENTGTDFSVDYVDSLFPNPPSCTVNAESTSNIIATIKYTPSSPGQVSYILNNGSIAGAHLICVAQ